MSNISALRLQHEHPSDLSGQMPDLTHGFTIEAWVRPAPMDQSVRLYPQPGYGGAPVRLKEGLYRRMAADHLPQLGSACLPEDMEAVFFNEPDFQGDTFAIRQDLPQAPDSHQQIGSVVVLDRSHRRQNHVVLFAQADYQGKAEVLILPNFWQRPGAHAAEQQTADPKPGLTQVGSAWVPPGVALEVTQLHTTHVADAGSMTFELWTCDSQFRTVYDVQFVTPSIGVRPVLNSTNDLPREWGVNVQAGQPAALPKNRVLFLFEKAGFAGRQTILAGQDAGQRSHLATVGSAVYVAVEGTEGVIGIGPKSQPAGEPQIRFFAVGDPLPADAINWHFWVPPDFCLVPGRDEAIPDRIGSGRQMCPGGASYIVKRTTGSQQGKDTRRIAEGIQRVQRPPDQPKTREGQGIYRLADGRWETFKGPGQSWLQDVPAITTVNIPTQRALFLFKKPLAQIESDADYEILADGVFDLGGLAWQPQAAIFVAAPHGTDGVLSLSHHGQVIPVDRAMRSSDARSVWAPPGFEMIREQREWESGFHEHIAVSGYRVAQLVRSTLQGDSADFPADVRLIKTRRARPLVGEELVYTTRAQPDVEVRATHQLWGSTNDVPDFRTVHVPEGGTLFLFEEYFAGSYQGRIEIVTGSRSDLGALSWTPKLAAFAAAPAGPDGILGYQPELRVFAPGTSDLPADVSVWFPKGYRVSDRIDPAYLRYISGQPDGSPVGLSFSDVIVERYAGILSSHDGYGLTIERTQSELRGAGDELRFGGELLRPDRWYHLAQTWDSETGILQWYLNGRPVKQSKLRKSQPVSFTSWALGRCFRGALAQVRVWNVARTPEQIRDERYPSTQPANAPTLDLFAQGVEAWQAPPDAVVVSADLPAAPTETVFVKHMQQHIEAENARSVQAAHQQATVQKVLAHKQAQRKLALARQQARRDVHSKGMNFLCFVRGSDVVCSWPKSNQDPEIWSYDPDIRVTDAAAVVDGEGRRCCYTTIDGRAWLVYERANLYEIATSLPNPPLALTCDASGTNDLAKIEGQIYTGIYWVEANGAVCRTWHRIDILSWQDRKPGERQQLFDMPAPLGRPKAWDLALDTERQILYWTNGWELYKSSVNDNKPAGFEIVVPHVVSPFPVAVAVAPNGALLWLDAEDEMVRMVQYDPRNSKFGTVIDLYPAPRPANGLVVSRLADDRKSGQESAFVYWVAAERRTLEAPVLDTPGRYIDLYYDPKHPRWHGQHVDMVALSEFTGAHWTDVGLVMTPDQAPAPDDDAKYSRALSFGVRQNSDSAAADQNAQVPGPDAVLGFDPIRIDLKQGWTVSTDLIWEGSGSDPKVSVCLYELATFEGEERIVCLVEPDEADNQSGIPSLYLRWNGHVLSGAREIMSGRRLRINELHHVTWMLDRRGVVSTFIDGEKVVEEQISLPDVVRVFEAHSLGAPDTAQTHLAREWTNMTKRTQLHDFHDPTWGVGSVDPDPYLVNPDDPKQAYASFHGRIVRFCAWNCTVPQAAQGWEHTPGPDPTWARSLVTVESKHRYLHAGRLDGQEPPVTLFPIDMDGGLNIETALDQAHAELTLAHAQKAAAEEHAAQLKAAALQDAHAKLEAATQTLGDTQAKAAADVAAAQAQADRDKAAARDRMSDADAQAERDRVQGKQEADQYKADKKKTAEDTETRAADDKRARITDANQRRADEQRKVDERR